MSAEKEPMEHETVNTEPFPIPPDAQFNGRASTEKETAAFNLRQLMKEAEGENKCKLCKAAEALEKKESSGVDWMAILLLIILFSGGNIDSSLGEAAAKAYLDALEKERKEKEQKPTEDDDHE